MPELKGFFGYRAGLVGTPYITEAAALEDTTLCLIPLPVIKQLIRENHTVALFFIEHLATLLGHADEQTVSLTQKHLRGRLAEALLIMKDRYGADLKSNTLAMEPSREDLANLSNMTTSNAIRTLSSFVSERLVAADGRKITILDEPQLRLIAKNG
jgi:CRP-like cAMP-binding protein